MFCLQALPQKCRNGVVFAIRKGHSVMRISILSLIVVSALSTSSGCATVIKGRYQDLTINSYPPGAAFEVDGIAGTTPSTVPVERKQRYHTVVISKPGHETAQIQVGRRLNLWILGNVIFGPFIGPIGLGADFITGSAFRLTDDSVHVNLSAEYPVAARQPAATAPGEPQLLQAEHIEPPPAEHPAKPMK
jgi:hypothetical protein